MSGIKVVAFARKLLGVPFKYGGASPDGFDINGFVIYCYKQSVGIDLPKDINGLLTGGTKVSLANLKLGDLVFISSIRVGIFIGNNKIIHGALTTADVSKISEIKTFYTARRYID